MLQSINCLNDVTSEPLKRNGTCLSFDLLYHVTGKSRFMKNGIKGN
jgi:hypothetical protein